MIEVKDKLIKILKGSIEKLKHKGKISSEYEAFYDVEIPKESEYGDLYTNLAFVLAKPLKVAPYQAAQEIVNSIDLNQIPEIDKIEITSTGYINFILSKNYLFDTLHKIIKLGEAFGKCSEKNNKKVLIEFVSANPTGPLNVVNARAASVGDAIANLLEAIGYDVYREYYVNDVGRQVILFGESLRARYLEQCGIKIPFPEQGYQGEYVTKLAAELVAQQKIKVSDYNDLKDIPLEVFQSIGIESMVAQQKKDLERFNIKFDNWFFESSLHKQNKLYLVLEELRKRGYTYSADNAIWFKATAFGDEKDRVLIREDGSPTYFLADIAYHKEKFERRFDLLINIWGPDHHGYIKRLIGALEALGYPSEKIKIIIIQQVTLLSNGEAIKMSKRMGRFETMEELIANVGVDAARFFFLMRSAEAPLEFDIEIAKEQTPENPVFYVQYAHARIASIFAEAKRKEKFSIFEATDLLKEAELNLLTLKEEENLMKKIAVYPLLVKEAAIAMEPHRITRYLMELANLLHVYYNHHRVLSDDISLTKARLVLMKAVQITLKNGLKLLGISAPDRM